jgi:hypothetical protein
MFSRSPLLSYLSFPVSLPSYSLQFVEIGVKEAEIISLFQAAHEEDLAGLSESISKQSQRRVGGA